MSRGAPRIGAALAVAVAAVSGLAAPASATSVIGVVVGGSGSAGISKPCNSDYLALDKRLKKQNNGLSNVRQSFVRPPSTN